MARLNRRASRGLTSEAALQSIGWRKGSLVGLLLIVLFAFASESSIGPGPSVASAQNKWTAQNSGTGADLVSVDFVDVHRGWAVGEGGVILATSDGGAHWLFENSGTIDNLFSVSFVDVQHGWGVGDCGVLMTADGGSHWIKAQLGLRL